ncbi:indole-3-glycerol phosphate synthase [Staphylococcus cohnii]
MERAYKLDPKIIGVNNRDLKRFVTDVLHTNEILENKKAGYYYISESGIRNKQDVASIIKAGIDGLLIGESLMKCDDLSQFLPSLKLDKVKV